MEIRIFYSQIAVFIQHPHTIFLTNLKFLNLFHTSYYHVYWHMFHKQKYFVDIMCFINVCVIWYMLIFTVSAKIFFSNAVHWIVRYQVNNPVTMTLSWNRVSWLYILSSLHGHCSSSFFIRQDDYFLSASVLTSHISFKCFIILSFNLSDLSRYLP